MGKMRAGGVIAAVRESAAAWPSTAVRGRSAIVTRVRVVGIGAAIVACLVSVAPALASGSRSVNGPTQVRGGQPVTYTMSGLLAGEPVVIDVQPRNSAGGNCCGIPVKGRWRTTSDGSLRVHFRFPGKYFYGCDAAGCAGKTSFPKGSRAVIEFTVTPSGSSPGGTPRAELTRSVTVRVR